MLSKLSCYEPKIYSYNYEAFYASIELTKTHTHTHSNMMTEAERQRENT